ncbi:MAG: ribonuclease T [Gammaproteobacteria bacterium]|nr:ribonuclease T [Gammaproteobacteria bacterium]
MNYHSNSVNSIAMNKRFRGFLPVVVDIETGGFNYTKDALLEVAFIFVAYSEINPSELVITDQLHFHIQPFPGANIDESSLEFTKIKPFHPFRFAIPEQEALTKVFTFINDKVKKNHCSRAVLVGHNPTFDLSFLQAAAKRCKLTENNPFHLFTTFDTATMGALLYKQTVLARAVRAAKIEFDENQAHSALYDAVKTAELFCNIVNKCSALI